MIIKRDMTAAESNYLQCTVLITVAGILIVLVSAYFDVSDTIRAVGYGSIVLGIVFLIGFFYLKKKADDEEIAKATKTVRKDQPKSSYKVKYTTRKERKAAKAAEAAKEKKAFPANKSDSLKKKTSAGKQETEDVDHCQ